MHTQTHRTMERSYLTSRPYQISHTRRKYIT